MVHYAFLRFHAPGKYPAVLPPPLPVLSTEGLRHLAQLMPEVALGTGTLKLQVSRVLATGVRQVLTTPVLACAVNVAARRLAIGTATLDRWGEVPLGSYQLVLYEGTVLRAISDPIELLPEAPVTTALLRVRNPLPNLFFEYPTETDWQLLRLPLTLAQPQYRLTPILPVSTTERPQLARLDRSVRFESQPLAPHQAEALQFLLVHGNLTVQDPITRVFEPYRLRGATHLEWHLYQDQWYATATGLLDHLDFNTATGVFSIAAPYGS